MMKNLDTILLAAMVTWASSAMADDGAILARGKHVFNQWCASCHGVGNHMAGTASLAAKYSGSIPAALEERTDLNPDFIRYFVRNGVLIMPAFRKTEVSDTDLAALAAYLSHPTK
ncbi:cytochrome c [Paraburkholderia sp. MM5384-R2]|uniref:c-type cytochrome n=1 Tax=Paraburkholderia sp. MM5384-R2 TaxID=2723097 RepID=UPI0017B6F112|nr:cytochrome c [Paraburkholderia sp. MM5384-R2]MBB5497610.1 mono/diheme cytochrome c family protein [Paraburkholderia sp. MM5384-R2]